MLSWIVLGAEIAFVSKQQNVFIGLQNMEINLACQTDIIGAFLCSVSRSGSWLQCFNSKPCVPLDILQNCLWSFSVWFMTLPVWTSDQILFSFSARGANYESDKDSFIVLKLFEWQKGGFKLKWTLTRHFHIEMIHTLPLIE